MPCFLRAIAVDCVRFSPRRRPGKSKEAVHRKVTRCRSSYGRSGWDEGNCRSDDAEVPQALDALLERRMGGEQGARVEAEGLEGIDDEHVLGGAVGAVEGPLLRRQLLQRADQAQRIARQ